jgi:two-component system, OmpR family, sensor histidine kinase MprB
VMKHGGVLRIEDTVPGGQPPGTSIYVLLPGLMPTAATPDGQKSVQESREISVDSQSGVAR